VKRKKLIIGLLIAAVVVVVGTRYVKSFIFENAGLISRIVDPIGENQEVVWEKGPATAQTTPENRPPNIVLIMADDLGANDISFAGGGVGDGTVATPNIDSIGQQGVSFTSGYSGHSTCAPSRASMLTGRYASRIGFVSTPAPAAFGKFIAEMRKDEPVPPKFMEERLDEVPHTDDQGLPLEEVTIPELLKKSGYHSVMLGKWHLGDAEGMRPGDQGFDEFLGFTRGSAKYGHDDDPDVVNARLDFDPIDIFQWKNLKPNARTNSGGRFEPRGYMTDYLTEEAVKAIEHNKNRPFFMYLAYNAPHSPLQAKKADYEALSHIDDHTERVYGAMIRALDRGVGQVLEALKQNGLEENTLVIFTSDNGGANYLGLPNINKPYRGWKMTLFEGGVNVPFFMKWPTRIPKGITDENPVMQLDLFSTIAAATGTALPTDRKIDGVDLLPYVTGEAKGRPHDTLFWDNGGYQAVIAGGWKLHSISQLNKRWLFDMKADPTEQNNLAESQPEKLAEMQTILADFNRTERAKPLWPALMENTVRIDKTLNQSWETGDEYIIYSN
jgi:arylsulfatase A-like enzyme